jgi:hypothetical protein
VEKDHAMRYKYREHAVYINKWNITADDLVYEMALKPNEKIVAFMSYGKCPYAIIEETVPFVSRIGKKK